MKRHLIGFCLLLATAGVSIFFFDKPLASDRSLIRDFENNRSEFERLVRMMEDDHDVMAVGEGYVLLKEYRVWRDDSDPGFSTKRWNEYKTLFAKLGNPYISHVEGNGGIIKIGSGTIAVSDLDDYESIVISKEYVYNKTEPSPLVDSLDDKGFDSPGPVYRKITGNWYLYFDSGISKPE